MNGLINIYKPSGMSSAHAVGKVKHMLGEKTVGHMGTLDPMAEGVLVMGVGKSTRLFDALVKKNKSYIAKFKFGYETDTLDAFGEVTQRTTDIPSADAVLGAVRSMIGEIDQIPPAYSAKHIGGKRAYAMARSGKTVELKPSRVQIFDACLIAQPRPDELVFSIDCSAGTYIRSICRDAARLCGSLATLTYLKRTRSGRFTVENSVTFERLEKEKDRVLIAPCDALDIPKVTFEADLYDDISNGRKVKCDFSGDAFVFCKDVLFGIGCADGGFLRIKTYLKD